MSRAGWQRAARLRGFDALFAPYVRRLVRRSFARVWLLRDAAPLPSGGYVAVANHSSWWDGFVPYLLHRAADPSRTFAIMMSDTELRRFPFFRYGGAFSIDATSPRAARPAIAYAAGEARCGAGVWIFPSGVLASERAWVPFTSGFVHAARGAGVPIVPVAMRFVMRGAQRPEAFVDIGRPVDAAARATRRDVEEAVRARLAAIDADLARGAPEERYRLLLDGGSGVDDRIDALLSAARRWLPS